jgi:hypothetical protein
MYFLFTNYVSQETFGVSTFTPTFKVDALINNFMGGFGPFVRHFFKNIHVPLFIRTYPPFWVNDPSGLASSIVIPWDGILSISPSIVCQYV